MWGRTRQVDLVYLSPPPVRDLDDPFLRTYEPSEDGHRTTEPVQETWVKKT